MFFELPWVGVAMDAMAVAISVKYSESQNPHITFLLTYNLPVDVWTDFHA